MRTPPPKPRIRRIVALPSSIFAELEEPLRTCRAGFLARTLAIFRVEEVVIYREGGFSEKYLVDILRYMDTPQYLRRRLITRSKSLKYAGILPPLRTPHHPSLRRESFRVKFREGVVLSRIGDWIVVDVGLHEPVKAKGTAKVGERVILSMEDIPKVVSREDIPYYWGYEVTVVPSLTDIFKRYGSESVVIVTSRRGEFVGKVARELIEDILDKRSFTAIFGTWNKGLMEIAKMEGFSLKKAAKYILNFIPLQGTFTVRTEEAVTSVLSILNHMLALAGDI